MLVCLRRGFAGKTLTDQPMRDAFEVNISRELRYAKDLFDKRSGTGMVVPREIALGEPQRGEQSEME